LAAVSLACESSAVLSLTDKAGYTI
jgi:hypothetical protein